MSTTLGSLAPWFGSKRTLAPEIVRELGDHRIYWEPFAGSMAVLLAKPACRTEVVNDLHGDLVNLARVIQDRSLGPALYRRLRRVLFSEAEFRSALIEIRNPPSPELLDETLLDRAFRYFIVSWMGMNGVAGLSAQNTSFCRRFSSLGGDPAVRFRGAVQSIPAWRHRMERVQILQSDGIDLLLKIEDRDGTVIYVDPPYLVKGAKYLHDFSDGDHARLASALGRFKRTRVVVSYYDHPRLVELYPGWNLRHLDVAKSMVNSGERAQGGATKAPEVLLVNGPLVDDAHGVAFRFMNVVPNPSLTSPPNHEPLPNQTSFLDDSGVEGVRP